MNVFKLSATPSFRAQTPGRAGSGQAAGRQRAVTPTSFSSSQGRNVKSVSRRHKLHHDVHVSKTLPTDTTALALDKQPQSCTTEGRGSPRQWRIGVIGSQTMIAPDIASLRLGHMPSAPHFVYLGTLPKAYTGSRILFILLAWTAQSLAAFACCGGSGLTAHCATPPPVCFCLISVAVASSSSSPSQTPAPDCSPGSKPILILLGGTLPYLAKLSKIVVKFSFNGPAELPAS